MALDPFDEDAYERAQNADIDAVADELVEEARLWARQLRRRAALADRAHASPHRSDERFLVLELAGSWRVSQLTAGRWIDDAQRFSAALPRTLDLLERGQLLVHQARVLLQRTRHCPEAVARAVEAEVLPDAAQLCPSDLRRRVDLAVLRHESEQGGADAIQERHAEAAAERRVYSRPEPDGMALVGAVLTAEQQVAWSAAMDVLERRERVADRAVDSTRTSDQRRADLFAALPAMVLAGTGAGAGARPAGADAGAAASALTPWTVGPEQLAATVVLNVHVPVSTVLDLSREPGTLAGYGPIAAEHVRLLRPAALRRVMVDGHSGRPVALDDRATPAERDPASLREQVQEMLRPDVVVDVDEPQHDPSARLARLVDVRDQHCSGPGCSATRTHRDHHLPWPLGPTSARNLSRLSARCHAAKHAGWHLERHADGSTTWRSPLGRTYFRPGPHQPPPPVDVYAEPPLLRPPPEARAPWETERGRPDVQPEPRSTLDPEQASDEHLTRGPLPTGGDAVAAEDAAVEDAAVEDLAVEDVAAEDVAAEGEPPPF